MSHITEGLLHAHLDGAVKPDLEAEWAAAELHLEACADCRLRLEEARGLREGAGDLLAGATVPAGAPPPFSDIVSASRTGSSAGHGAGWLRSTPRLAWAASLVLAAGAGWIGRELLIQNRQEVPALVAERAADEDDAFGDLAEAEGAAEVRQQEAPAGKRLDEQQPRVAGEAVSSDGREAKIIAVAREIMAAAHFAALVSLDDTGHPRARAMDPFPPEADMTVWMATNPASRKVEQIRGDPRVTVYYFDAAGMGYVTLMGEARIVDDPEEKERRWKPEWEAFYPDRESSYLLIQVRPNRLEVVSVKHGLSGDPVTWTPDGLSLGPR